MTKQFNALEVPLEGVNIIEAGAGTGKTYNIASLFVRAIIEKKLLPSQVLVLTYTKAATSELKARLRARIRDCIAVMEGEASDDEFLLTLKQKYAPEALAHLKQAFAHFDEASISTIHGFCQKLLGEYSVEFEVTPGFDILTDESELFQEATDQFWRRFFSISNTNVLQVHRDYLQRLFKDPERLLKKIVLALVQETARIQADVPELQAFDMVVKNWNDALHRLKQVLEKEKQELLQFLTPDNLNKKQYFSTGCKGNCPKEIIRWIEALKEVCPPHSKLVKFSSEGIAKGSKKGVNIPEHLHFFDAIDQYLLCFEEYKHIEAAFLKQAITEIRAEVRQLKKSRFALGYNDLLNIVEAGLQSNPTLAHTLLKRFPVALIDEFQDTDHVQYAIFNHIYTEARNEALFFIGDPKQAIYRFRGADINTYLVARDKVPEEQRFTLRYNYRSEERLIRGINAFFNKATEPFAMPNLHFEEALYPAVKSIEKTMVLKQGKPIPPVQCIELKGGDNNKKSLTHQAAESVATEIVGLLKEGYTLQEKPVSEEDIAVLVSNHAEAELVEETLLKRGIKSILKSKKSVYSSLQASELYLILHAIASPFNDGLIKAALGTELLGLNIYELREIEQSQKQWNRIREQFLELYRIWSKQGFTRCMEHMLAVFEVEAKLMQQSRVHRKITNLTHVLELLNQAFYQKGLSISGMLAYLKRKMEHSTISRNEEEEIRLESDENLVQIVTMHASKGLEYPIVFCPFLWSFKEQSEEYFTISDGQHLYMELHKNSDRYEQYKQKREQELFSERLRLTYVALTRAKSACYVYWLRQELPRDKNPILYLIQHNQTNESEVGNNPDIFEWRTAYVSEGHNVASVSVSKTVVETPFSRRNSLSFARIMSYSSLASSLEIYEDPEKPGFDNDDLFVHELSEPGIAPKNVFTLPKGKHTGNLLHTIFERISFNTPDTFAPAVEQVFEETGFEAEWKPIVLEVVHRTVAHSLAGEITLSQIADDQRITEMQFHFPAERINAEQLTRLIRVGEFQNISQTAIHGYMMGYIDLVFIWEGRFYILDYKSNHLGDEYSEYTPEAIAHEMKAANYDLQYHIYSVALHRYLQVFQPNYEFEHHFGGVFYAFVRGMQPNKPGSGVFYDRPQKELILELDNLLGGKGK